MSSKYSPPPGLFDKSMIDPQGFLKNANTRNTQPEYIVVEEKVQFIIFPSLTCPECRFQMYTTTPDGIRVFIDHPTNEYCSRSNNRVIRPVTDFYKCQSVNVVKPILITSLLTL